MQFFIGLFFFFHVWHEVDESKKNSSPYFLICSCSIMLYLTYAKMEPIEASIVVCKLKGMFCMDKKISSAAVIFRLASIYGICFSNYQITMFFDMSNVSTSYRTILIILKFQDDSFCCCLKP